MTKLEGINQHDQKHPQNNQQYNKLKDQSIISGNTYNIEESTTKFDNDLEQSVDSGPNNNHDQISQNNLESTQISDMNEITKNRNGQNRNKAIQNDKEYISVDLEETKQSKKHDKNNLGNLDSEDNQIKLISNEKLNCFERAMLSFDNFKLKFANILGLLFMIMGCLLLIIVMLMFKHICSQNPQFTLVELLLVRAIFQFGIHAIQYKLFKLHEYVGQITRHQWKLMVWRSGLSLVSMCTYWYSIQYLYMGLVSVIQFLTPFITLLLGFIILKETLKRFEILNMFLGFAGVLIIVYSQESNQQKNQGNLLDISRFQFWSSIVSNIISTIFISIIYVLIRQLKSIHYVIINGVYAIILLTFSLILMLTVRKWGQGEIEYNFTAFQYAQLCLLGLMTTISNSCFILAFQLDKAGRAAAIGFIEIIFGYVGDIIFFSYSLVALEAFGAFIIILCSVIQILLKYYKYSE